MNWINSEEWPTLKKYGLTCAISGIPVEGRPFIKGFNNPDYHPMIDATKKAIDDSADFGCPNVIAFTGYKENFSAEDGAQNCIEGFGGAWLVMPRKKELPYVWKC